MFDAACKKKIRKKLNFCHIQKAFGEHTDDFMFGLVVQGFYQQYFISAQSCAILPVFLTPGSESKCLEQEICEKNKFVHAFFPS